MKKNNKPDQENSTKAKGPKVTVMGSSIVYRDDDANKSTRFTTLYGPNSPGLKPPPSISSDGFFAYTHPQYEDRPRRLDLMSNRLNKVELKVNGISSSLCDISNTGFSYAKRLSKVPGDYYHIKKIVANSQRQLVGQKIDASFQSVEEKAVKVVNISGTVRNVRLVYGLLLNEAELEFKKFLYRKTITRNNDKFDSYKKLEYLMDLVNEEIQNGSWSDELAVSVNTTILNMMLEIGATEDAVDKMYENYNARPRFIRFGIKIDSKEQAEQLENLTRSISSVYKQKIEEEKQALKDAIEAKKAELVPPQIPIDFDFNFQKFLLKSWYGCLARFGLDYRTEKLKSINHNLAKHLKTEARAFEDALNRLPDKKPGQMNLKATELLITEGILRGLDKKQDNSFENIEADIRVIVNRTFELCIREFINKLQD
ncbi:MAG: hypothetical protein MJE63_26260 [Proteobacteria bacterium]|nr:hypothetical protein [Pseudomonadota bacterium]